MRQVLGDGAQTDRGSDDRIFAVLRELGFEQIATQAGGLDTERDWGTLLSLSEQQLLAVTHILLQAPLFVFLDRLGATLSSDQLQMVLQRLAKSLITHVSIGAPRESLDLFDAILECGEDGGWAWTQKPAARSDADEPLART